MWLSSLHRITGLLLSLGAIALGVWLIALASGPESYAVVRSFAGSGAFKVLLIGWTFAFFFHLSNGVRHLFWDLGLGYGKTHIQASGWAVVLVTVIASAAFSWAVIL
jgi:succinate dehydrogenase / fumarate reductase cytochrome b subunit